MSEVTSLRCYRKHLRTAKICGDGARGWWKRHGLNWSDFLSNGIPAQVLLDTGDPFALRVVEIAREEQNG